MERIFTLSSVLAVAYFFYRNISLAVFFCCFFFSTSGLGQSFSFAGPQDIPDNNCSNGYNGFPVVVSGVGILDGTYIRIDSVRINFTMAWDADLNIWLQGPGGAVLELSTGNGDDGDNYTNTTFSDNATTFITAGTAPFSGSFRPEGRYNYLVTAPPNTPALGTYTFANTYNGSDADGEWTLKVCDGAQEDSASIQNWTIYFSGCSYSYTSDAGITTITGPVAPFASGSNPVLVALRNYGTQALTSAQINWSVNGVLQAPFAWSGNLSTAETDTVAVGNFDFVVGELYEIMSWPGLPNGQMDSCVLNDTAQIANISAALSGIYTIGGANPSFASFNEATQFLQYGGVIGPTILNVRDGTYTEKVTLLTIPGASPVNTVTFQSESNDSTAVVLQEDPTANGGYDFYVLKLQGASHVRFKKMTVKALGANSSKVLVLRNDANQNAFTNCVFEGTPSFPPSTGGLFDVATVENCEQDTFVGNRFIKGYTGIGIYTYQRTGIYIATNQFENQSWGGMFLNGAVGIQILGNRFFSDSVITGYNGIYVFSAYAFRIESNWISSNSAQYGIYLSYNLCTVDSPYLVANNFINISGNNAVVSSGIHSQYDQHGYILHNTVRITNTPSLSRAFYYADGTSMHVQNNVFAYYGNGRAAEFNPSNGLMVLDNNDYFSTNPSYLILGNGQEYTSLSGWQNATSYDEHSLATNPLFAHPDSFRVLNNALNGAGAHIASVPTDIQGQLRDINHPDLGCDEFDASGLDAGVFAIMLPDRPFSVGPQPVKAIIRNHGDQALTSVQVNWVVNDTLQTPVSLQWSPGLPSGSTDTVDLGMVNFVLGNSYNIVAWTDGPNSMTDDIPANDTSEVSDVYAGLSGTYTIGGTQPDFSSFNQAIAQLNNGGAAGPVVFNVRNGTYNEQISINQIQGASATNTITLQSESGDSSQVILTYGANSSLTNYTVFLNGADYIRLRKMTIRATGIVYARAVVLQDSSNNNILENNWLESISTTSTSLNYAIVYSGADKDDNNIIRNNYFYQGSDGVFTGGTTTLFEDGNVVQNNTFVNQSRRSINLFYQNASVIEGNSISSATTYSFYNGIVAYFCNGAQRVTGNKITLNTGSIGIAIDNCSGTALERGLTVNNFVQAGGSIQSDGIGFYNSNYQNCYYNSIHSNGTNVNSRPLAFTTGADNRLFNNIAVNSGNGTVIWRSNEMALSASDHNDFYTTGPNLVYTQSTNSYFSNLATWQTGTGFDANSVSVDPQFASPTDLHVSNIFLEGGAQYFPEVITDIDGQTRNMTAPDIGADEFLSDSLDATLVRFVQLAAPVPAGPAIIKVLLKNNGTNTLTSVLVKAQLNTETPIEATWTGSLPQGDSVVVELGSVDLPDGRSNLLTAWTVLPNDQSPENDTLRFETDGLVAYYSFCGCSADDNSGMTNGGVFVGSPACETGKSGQGILLNPTAGGNNGCGLAGGQYVQLPPFDAIWQDGFTVSAWVRFDNPSSYERIIDIGNGSGDLGGMPVWFGREGTTNNLMMDSWISSNGNVNRTTGRLSAPNTIVNGVFQHYCATIGPGNIMRIYVNGQLRAEKTGHPILNVPRSANFIGHSNWCPNDPDTRALIDELRLYNRAFSPAEINTLYLESPSFAEYNQIVCAGAPVQLEARGGIEYQWSPTQDLSDPNIANPVATPQDSITYNCQITLADGCAFMDSLHIAVADSTAMNGIYTIGGVSPDYPGFVNAVNDLVAKGVCGPVVFKVRNGTYVEQLDIPPVPGASPENTITFESENGDSSQVILTFSSASSTASWTVRLNGADNITFRKITIEANGSSYAQVVQMTGDAQYNSLFNNVLKGRVTTSTSANLAVVYTITGVNKNLVFRNNKILNGSVGLWLNGVSNDGAYIPGIVVDSNKFENQYYQGAFMSYVNKARVRANSISSNATYSAFNPIRILNGLDSTEITHNRIFNVNPEAYGIRLENQISLPSAPALVANNFVEITGTTTRQALYIYTCSYVNILHNTVKVLNTSIDSRALEATSSSNLFILNNIFYNTGGGYAAYKSGGTSFSSNFNTLYSKGNRTGYWNGTITADLTAWRISSGNQDMNSVAYDPQFTGPGAYRPRAIELDNLGTPAGIMTDIDGDARDSQHPDMGADEFSPDSVDAALPAFAAFMPPVPAGQTPVRVLLKNNGLSTITSTQVSLKVNNETPVSFSWAGALASGDSVEVVLDTINLIAGQTYNLYAWSSMPNGIADSYPANDTAKLLNLVPALSGIYTIGGTAPDFPTFTAAVSTLAYAGVVGPVTFNVRNGIYTEQISLAEIPGVDSTKTVTFQSESGDSSLVSLEFNANSAANYTLQLNGADYIRFRKMTLRSLNTTYARVVNITGGANNNRFENNRFVGISTTSTSDFYTLVFSASGTTDNGNEFRKNLFQNGSWGMLYFGSSGAYETGTKIDSNRFENQYNRAINFIYQDAAMVRGNTILGSASAYVNFVGILAFNCSNKITITNNQVFMNTGTLAITIQSCYGTVANRGLIANNFIWVGGVSTGVAAFFSSSSSYQDVVFNTVLQTNTSTGYCAASLSSSTYVNILNNIFTNTGGGYALCINNTTTGIVSDYNDLYTTGASIAAKLGIAYTDLPAWQAGAGYDAHSRSVFPVFISPTDLHVSDVEINNAGTPFSGITTDIDGQLRDVATPDIGADEFMPAAVDAGISFIITPVAPFPAGLQPVQVVLKNQGTDTLTSTEIDWTLNGVIQATIPWSGSLASGQTEAVSLPSVNFTIGQATLLKAWSSNPNAGADLVATNDTSATPALYPGLGGTYTIGGGSPDFSSFNETVNALQNGGVVDAVTFNVRAGVYAEQLTLNPVLGTSAANTVTFQSEANDSTQVTLQFNATTSTANYTVRFNGADWFRFRKMTLKSLSSSYARVLDLNGGSDNNIIENNYLTGAGGATTNFRAIIYSASGTIDNGNVFRNNYIQGGSYGIQIYGSSATSGYETGTVIENNRFEDQYFRAINIIYQVTSVIGTNYITSNTVYSAYRGIETDYCNAGQKIHRNQLILNNAQVGIYIYACIGTASNPGLVSNNFVQIGGMGVAEGILLSAGAYQYGYFNSIHINNTNTSSRAFSLFPGGNCRLYNNVGYNSGGGLVIFQNTAGSLEFSDNNDWYSTGSNLAYTSSLTTYYPDLASWQNATGYDANSLSIDPQFVSSTDLHTANVLLDGAAVPFPEVTDDIDGQPRNGTMPDIGADEFVTTPDESGVQSIDYPKKAFPAGIRPVQVTLFNNGVDTLYSVEIAWELNGIAQPSYLWSGNLLSGGTLDSVVIGNAVFDINTPYFIRAWTKMPNGMPDGDLSNDTAQVDNLYAGLGGSYSLGGVNPDFPTFSSAVNAMILGGVVDSVFFNVRAGIYTEQLILKEVFGAGADRRITFQAESSDSTSVTLTFNSISANNFTIKLDSADWFRFRYMTLEAGNTSYGRVIHLLNRAENNQFEHCVIRGTGNSATNTELIYSSTSNDNGNSFIGNRFEGGRIGIYMYGGSIPGETNLLIKNNVFNNQGFSAIYLQYESNPIITGNIITNVSNSGLRGIYLSQCSNSYEITKNRISLLSQYGIYLSNSDSPQGNSGLIDNNFISIGNGGSLTVYGLYLQSSDNVRIYHNNVNIRSTFNNSRALFNGSNGVDVKNNVFACVLGAIPVEHSVNTTNISSDYNDLYTTGSNTGVWQSTFLSTLAEWQLNSGQDFQSRAINPQFISDTDLHIEEASLNNAGTPIAVVTDDIDGEARNPLTPDIGADEFAPMSMHDAGVELLLEPSNLNPFPAGLHNVKAVLKNNGIDTIMTMSVQWRVNNVPRTPLSWAGMLYPGERDTVVIGTHNFAIGNAYNLVAFTQNPDGFPDTNPANDTAKATDLYAGLNGIYTLGGVVPNFPSFSAAVTSLTKGGVLGPVVFNVRNGTYTESLTLTNIKGSSAVNTVTFQSESGDSSLVILKNTSNGIAFRLDNADNLIFRKMTFSRGNAGFFYLVNGVNNLQFLNNRFIEFSTNSFNYIESAGTISNDSDIKILNNSFEGGYSAIRLNGYNSSYKGINCVIMNNNIINNRGTAIYLSYQDAPIMINNKIATNQDAGGMYCSHCDNNVQISRNLINIAQDNHGIYLYYCDGSINEKVLVSNNFIFIGGVNYGTGISSVSGYHQNIYNNNVHVSGTYAGSAALYLSDSGNNKNILNNILYNTGGGLAYIYSWNFSIQVSNFNDLFSSGPYLARWNSLLVSDITALRNISGHEQNSLSINPLFYSATDLHVLQVALDSAGTYLADVPTDIDGEPRNPNFPDIGADEFDYRTDDVGITALLSPQEGCELGANSPVKVVIQNFGGLPQTGFDVAYKRGYGAEITENIGGRVVQPGDTIHYTFTQTTDMSAYQAHEFTLYTGLAGDLNLPNDTLITFVTNNQTPTTVANMLPADGAVDVDQPVSFSWLPSTGATRYDIYIWKADQPQPGTPTAQDLTQISYYYDVTNLVYGAAYNWQVVAKNNYCQTASPIQQFTLRELPDLSVDNVSAPAQPYSGSLISVSWTTTNNGTGATGMTGWYDYIYLSTDAAYQAGADTYLGGAANLTALNPGQGYSQMAEVMLPNGLQGNYYLIVFTDKSSNNSGALPESNENNNISVAFPVIINLTPPPDLKVLSIAAPTNAFSGQQINITWTVKNQGSGDVPPGNAFQDYVYLSSTPTLNLNTATLLGTYVSAPIAADASAVRMLTAQLPPAVFGDYYIHVYTDRNNNVFEFAFEDNNIGVSDTMSIFLTPPPDLIVSSVTGPAFVSNNQSVTVQWTVENQGATTANGTWTDHVYVSKSATYNPDSLISLGAGSNPGNLPAGESISRSRSVTIPANIGGTYYFYVLADATNQVFEYLSENNNSGRSAVPTEVLNADLIVPLVTVPDTASSGTSIAVQWTVKNTGMGSLLNIGRSDRIYLSQLPVLDVPSATFLGELAYGGTLLSGQEVGKQTNVALPNGISGKYYVHVLTDAGNNIYETPNEGNNSNLDSIVINLSPWPDLEPVSLGAIPDTLLAGQNFSFSYTVQNTGTATAARAGGWQDGVYISSNPVFDAGSATSLQTLSLLQPVPAGGSYNPIVPLNLPFAAPGLYYLHVITDAVNGIYEYTDEDNNTLSSTPFYLATPAPVDFDVMEDELSAFPDTVNSGQQVNLSWCIQNLGSSTAKFDFQFWYDGVYLSTDSIWDEYGDIFVKDFTKNGPVDSLQEYNIIQNFSIPNGLSGNYYAFLVADHNERTNDEERANNVGHVRPASYPAGPVKPVHIKLSPSPDLVPLTFVAPTSAVSGQPVQVIWTVKNNGPGATPANWTDKVYLSTDFIIGGNDPIIGTKNQNRVLAPGQSYTDTMNVFIPITSSGNFVLIFSTDANNALYEYNGENNNIFFSFLTADLPAPSDLVVSSLSFPSMAMVGELFDVTWSIKNEGANPATGVMRELIYFSTDSVLDVSDPTLSAPLSRSISLVPGASASKMYSSPTPGLPLGEYHIIVATDVLDNIFESNEGNNIRISPEKVMVTLQELPIGVLTPDTLMNNTALYYRIEVPDSLTDETLKLTLDALVADGVNELYLSYGAVPTRSVHDFAFSTPFSSDQSILVPELQAGTYYLLAYGATATGGANAKQAITLKAEIINFSVLSVMDTEGGNTGSVTLRIDGAKFTPTMTLKLKGPSLTTITAFKIYYINSTRVFATFNLAGAPVGLYDMEASRQAEIALLPDAFTVLTGNAGTTNSGDGSGGFFCTIVNIGTDQNLSENILHPSAVRVNRLVPITIQYGNAGNVDIPSPSRFLISLRGAPLGFTPDELDQMKLELYLEFQEIGGPPGILRPGSFSSTTVYSFSSHPLSFILRE